MAKETNIANGGVKSNPRNAINRFGLGRRTAAYRSNGLDRRTRAAALEQLEVRADNLMESYGTNNPRNRERIQNAYRNMQYRLLR